MAGISSESSLCLAGFDMCMCSCSEELNRKENESLKPIVQKLQSAKDAIDAGNAKRGRFGCPLEHAAQHQQARMPACMIQTCHGMILFNVQEWNPFPGLIS